MSNPRHALVIGANRGIGLELVRQLRARGLRVTATCRKDRGGLGAVEGVAIIDGVDLEDPKTLDRLAGALDSSSDPRVDDLIVNAGVYPSDRPSDGRAGLIDPAALHRAFTINAAGPLLAVQAVRSRLSRGARVILVTSRMGSIADNDSGGSYAYRMSKAALNMAGKNLSIELRREGVAVAIVHPGWVRTDMTHGQGLIDAPESAAGILARLDELTLDNSGTFWHQNGQVLPW